MSQADFGTGKSLIILAIVLGCFAILWPKIFYPMMQTAFAMTSPKLDADGRFRDSERPPHLHPASVNPRGRGPSADDPFPHPQVRQPAKSQPKSGGAMSIIMPIYTIGIIVFFLYTILKLVFKKPNEGDKKPLIKDFHMDPEYRKFVCQQSPQTTLNPQISKVASAKKQPNLMETSIPEVVPETTKEMDPKDFEIFKLRKKLEETEEAMERIIKHMGVVNACLNERVKLEKEIVDTQKNDIRQRHKGDSKSESEMSKTSKNYHIQEEDKVSHSNVNVLEEDLAELISMCNISDESMQSQANFPDSDQDDEKEEYLDGSDSDGEYVNGEVDENAQLLADESKCITVNGHYSDASA